MIGVFNTITINETEVYRGNDFALQREWIYAGEIVTCTGKVCADVVGWRYSNLTVSWDTLPQDQLQAILALNGEAVDMTFSNEQNETVTEQVIPQVISSQVTRFTDHSGNVMWKGIALELRFINAHN
ncbi:MAG: hypothetical protein IKF22_08650 [Lachnospiraceae bacterium]|nr:hypothetical protein [Lachnospiraceae bacterium]